MSDPAVQAVVHRCTSVLVYDIGLPYKSMYRCSLPAGHAGVHSATVGKDQEETVVTWTREAP